MQVILHLKLKIKVLVWLCVWSKVQMIAYGQADVAVVYSSLFSSEFRINYLYF